MAKKLSQKSRSFGRYKKHGLMGGVNIENEFIYTNSNLALKEYLKLFNMDEREVYYAENLNTKTANELKVITKELASFLEERLNENGERLQGIVELHPTGDTTSKSAHIHYWGGDSKKISPFISQFIKQNSLSNKNLKSFIEPFFKDEIKAKEINLIKKVDKNLQTLKNELKDIENYLLK